MLSRLRFLDMFFSNTLLGCLNLLCVRCSLLLGFLCNHSFSNNGWLCNLLSSSFGPRLNFGLRFFGGHLLFQLGLLNWSFRFDGFELSACGHGRIITLRSTYSLIWLLFRHLFLYLLVDFLILYWLVLPQKLFVVFTINWGSLGGPFPEWTLCNDRWLD